MSKNYQNVNNLKISEELLSFVNNELLIDLAISSEKFWIDFYSKTEKGRLDLIFPADP